MLFRRSNMGCLASMRWDALLKQWKRSCTTTIRRRMEYWINLVYCWLVNTCKIQASDLSSPLSLAKRNRRTQCPTLGFACCSVCSLQLIVSLALARYTLYQCQVLNRACFFSLILQHVREFFISGRYVHCTFVALGPALVFFRISFPHSASATTILTFATQLNAPYIYFFNIRLSFDQMWARSNVFSWFGIVSHFHPLLRSLRCCHHVYDVVTSLLLHFGYIT